MPLPKDRRGRKGNGRRRYEITLAVSAVVLIIIFVSALSVGRYRIDFLTVIKVLFSRLLPIERNWDRMTEAVIFTLRLPRSLSAVVIGSAMALSGACYQSIFRNPMVSPDLLGVTSGSCVGAAVAILLDGTGFAVELSAFLTGVLTVFITTTIARLLHNEKATILVLSGVIVSSFMSSLMSILKYVADTDTKLAEITYWTMGSFASITMSDILMALPFLVLPSIVILSMSFRLNVLSLGDGEAQSLGVDLGRTRGAFIICSTLLTAASVCLAGTIGWVGLVIPHVSRLITGADNKRMLPLSMLLGSSFMLVIDILSRTITAAELKLGILTGIIGAPFFFFILFRQNRKVS